MNRISLSDLSYILFSARQPSTEHHKSYEQAYSLWHSVWKDTLQSLDGTQTLFSDEFTRQDHVGAVFCEDRCLMLCLFRTVNLAQPIHRDDSYFKIWSAETLNKLRRDSDLVVIATHLALSPEVRGDFHGLSMKDVLLNIGIEYTKASGASVQTGVTRNNRGMNKVGLRAGGTVLQADVPLHGVDTDLFGFFVKDLLGFHNEWTFAAKSLWQNRIISDANLSAPNRKVG